jgi:hypothetical protein
MMFDTGTFWIEENGVIGKVKNLDISKEIVSPLTGEISWTGTLGNFRVKVTSKGISAIGSLPKYLFGNNFQKLTRKNTEAAIEKLSDESGLDFRAAKIYRLDIAANFVMQEAVQSYLDCLGEARHYVKRPQGKGGLLYTNSKRAITFYDKAREAKKKRQVIPDLWKCRNVLRYELHITQRLPEVFGGEPLTGARLYEEKYYIEALAFWEKEYFSIQRKAAMKFKDAKSIDVKMLQRHLLVIGLERLGEAQAVAMIEQAKRDGHIRKDKASKLKAFIRQVAQTPELTEPQEAIIELDGKVKQAVQHFR